MTFSRILAATMLLLVATGGAAAADPKRILLIHSFAQDFSPWREYEHHIRAELRRQLPEPLEIFELRSQPHGLPTKPLTMRLHSILAPFLPDTNPTWW